MWQEKEEEKDKKTPHVVSTSLVVALGFWNGMFVFDLLGLICPGNSRSIFMYW